MSYYDHSLGLSICEACREFILDGYCGCTDPSETFALLSEEERQQAEEVGRQMLDEVIQLDERRKKWLSSGV